MRMEGWMAKQLRELALRDGWGSQYSQGGSQLSATAVPENSTTSSGLYRHCRHMAPIHTGKTLLNIK